MNASPQAVARRIQFQPMRASLCPRNQCGSTCRRLPAVTTRGYACPIREDRHRGLPSYYGEGVPRSLIEAAACALPMVTTNHPGCREVATDGVDGLLVPVHDAGALAGAARYDGER